MLVVIELDMHSQRFDQSLEKRDCLFFSATDENGSLISS
jgi:hypothetical protein